MWAIFAGGRRRVVAVIVVVAALVLLAGAVVTAVILGAGPRDAAPPVVPGAGSPSVRPQTPTQTPTPTSTPEPQAPPSSVPPPGTEVPSAEAPEAPEAPATDAPPLPSAPTADPFPAALRGADVEVVPNAGRTVALTFDAGANSAGLPSILQTLGTAGVRATFFLTGTWAGANPAGVAAIAAAGHRVGNHSMTHPGFSTLSDAQIAQQLAGAQSAITAAGADSRPLFRFPFGERDARTIAAVNALGYVPVRWTVDTLGWKGTSGGITAQIVADRALSGLQPGEIILMHVGSNPDDGSTLDADALPQLIDRIRQAGYAFATLDALLG